MLVDQGIVGALIELGNVCEESVTISRIAVALCNLSSAGDEHRRKMLDGGVLASIVSLSSNYNNTIQQDAARSLCNLSYITGTETQLVEQGAIRTLMVIGLVWTDDVDTKILCAKALVNILACDESRLNLLEDGVISGAITLTIPSLILLPLPLSYILFPSLIASSRLL